MTHLHEDDLTLLFYGELRGRDERLARAHLEECGDCRRRRDELRRVLAMVDTCEVAEPPAGYEAEVWRRLQPALRAERSPRRHVLATLAAWLVPSKAPAWLTAGALAAVIIVAFAAGRFWPSGDVGETVRQDANLDQPGLRERVLLSALEDHFDRSEIVLVELSSAEPGGPIDISGEQRRAGDLLAATRLYRRAALQAGDRNVADVLDALERVLTEITLSPSTLSAYELGALQQRIEEQQLLFKLRVAGASLGHREPERRAADRRSAGV